MRPAPPLTFRQLETYMAFGRQLRRHIDRGLEDEVGLDTDSVRILMFVAQHSDADQRCIANDVTQATAIPSTKRLLGQMKEKGLIAERGIDAWGSDAKRKQLTITTHGESVLRKAMMEWERIAGAALKEINRDALHTLANALDALHDAPDSLERLFRLEGTNDWLIRR